MLIPYTTTSAEAYKDIRKLTDLHTGGFNQILQHLFSFSCQNIIEHAFPQIPQISESLIVKPYLDDDSLSVDTTAGVTESGIEVGEDLHLSRIDGTGRCGLGGLERVCNSSLAIHSRQVDLQILSD